MLKADRLFSAVLLTFAVIMLLLITINIQLSTMRVAFTTQVYGQKELLAGRPGALRFTALAGDGFFFEQDLSVAVRLVYEADGQDFKLFEGSNSLGDTVEANFTVPQRQGAAFIIATLTTPDGDEFVKIPVRVVAKSSGHNLQRMEIERTLARNKEGQRLAVPKIPGGEELYAYPESGLLAPRAENTIYLFSRPQPGQENPVWRFADPLTILHPDSWGIAKIVHNPDIIPTYALELENSDDDDGNSDKRLLTLELAPSQMMLKLDKYWAAPGSEITAAINTLRRQETIYLDIWYGSTLFHSQAVAVKDGRAQYKFTLPADLQGLFYFQIYRPFINAGDTQDGRAVYVSEKQDEDTLWQMAAAVSALPGGHDPLLEYLEAVHPAVPWHKGAMLPELLLSRLELKEPGIPLLYNSQAAKISAFSKQQEESRQQLYRAYVATGVLLLVTMVIFGVTRIKSTRRAVDTVLEESPELLDSAGVRPQISLLPNKAALLLLVIGVIISLWAVAILLKNLRWTIW